MRVPTVSKVNTRQQQNQPASQNTINAVVGKSPVGNSFQDCFKSFYQQKDAQKKARPHEYKAEDAAIIGPAFESLLPESDSDSNYIDIKR